MTDSIPLGSQATSWFVCWECENNATVDPASVQGYALCVTRL